MQRIEQQTLAGIALTHHEFIPVLEKYNLDFCCRGKKTLAEACTEKNIAITEVVNEMNESIITKIPAMPFTDMTAEQLISYIIIHHHFYVKNSIATIYAHIEKVATKHGERYPHMQKVLALFTEVVEELLPHMEKEELVLFPRIKEIAAIDTKQPFITVSQGFLSNPIQMMEAEHDTAGQHLFKIRELTNQYTPPESACTTHRICLEELKAFEEDLHKHVHLENNILFPMATHIIAAMNN